jgi:glycosyltransferase involved in cell wall biosynthesis
VIARTLQTPEIKGRLWESNVPSLPHGLDSSVFYPRDKAEARRTLIHRLSEGKTELPINNDVTLIGVVATNSFRKDWGWCLETCAELLKKGLNVFLWGHSNGLGTDGNPQLYWNLLSLANQFNMGQRVILTTHPIDDEDMAWAYSACDVTLGIGSGEGMGYPLMESLTCGVPVLHGDYAGGAEFVPEEFQVPAKGYRLESKWMIRRPVFSAVEAAEKVIELLTPEMKALARIPDNMIWDNLWPSWSKWLREGVE